MRNRFLARASKADRTSPPANKRTSKVVRLLLKGHALIVPDKSLPSRAAFFVKRRRKRSAAAIVSSSSRCRDIGLLMPLELSHSAGRPRVCQAAARARDIRSRAARAPVRARRSLAATVCRPWGKETLPFSRRGEGVLMRAFLESLFFNCLSEIRDYGHFGASFLLPFRGWRIHCCPLCVALGKACWSRGSLLRKRVDFMKPFFYWFHVELENRIFILIINIGNRS